MTFPLLSCLLTLITPTVHMPLTQKTHGPRLFVVNQGDKTMSIVDPATNTQVGVVDEAQTTMHGHEIAVGPDGRSVFMPIYGDVGVGSPGLDGNELIVIDWPTGKITGRIDFGHGVRPHCAVYSKATGMMYITTEIDNTITIVDPKTLKIVGTIPTSQTQSHMLAITRNGQWGYTSNVSAGTVSVLDMQARKTVTVIPISKSTQRIALSPDDRWAFTSDQTQHTLVVIDTKTNPISKRIELPGNGFGAAATPNGKWLLVPIPGKALVTVIDLKTLEIVKSIPVEANPQEMLVRPDGKFAYVASSSSKKVCVIDLKAWKMSTTIEVGNYPDGLAWAN